MMCVFCLNLFANCIDSFLFSIKDVTEKILFF